eukprot:9471740-Pyramimonas_sp.AAC.1
MAHSATCAVYCVRCTVYSMRRCIAIYPVKTTRCNTYMAGKLGQAASGRRRRQHYPPRRRASPDDGRRGGDGVAT